jgi:ATP-dependent helicase YprA (DUF1998 family)
MSPYLDPIAAATQPRKDFIRYLLTAYPLRDANLRKQFEEQLNQRGNIWQSPYLEGSQPYQPDQSVADLVQEGVLHPQMANLFDCSRKLYQHQAEAVRAVVVRNENIVVATGTGSGKTECFLMPMIDQLLKEEANLQTPGVRVLLLYPMNALVNDQVKRLRQLLCHQGSNHSIRFGFYTSRTEREDREAKLALKEELSVYSNDELIALLPASEKLRLQTLRREDLLVEAFTAICEVQAISREEIQKRPPHILVTNYSMLEHMLIRPVERRKIFEASRNTFNMLVIDEAHSYDGSTGTEVSMLVKRLTSAVGVETSGKIRCIATSASLGDESADPKVLEFAEQLFGEKFAQVIRGKRVATATRLGVPYSLPDSINEEEIYEYFQVLDLGQLTLLTPLEEWEKQLSYLVPAHILEKAKAQSASVNAKEQVQRFLWFALKQHPTIQNLIRILSQSPQPWEQIARSTELWKLPTNLEGEIIPRDEELQAALAHLVQLGTLARENPNDLPLLPIRLHLLFRSIEGIYACVNPNCCDGKNRQYGRLYLSEKETCDDCGSPVLALSSCRKCGQAYSLAYRGESGKLQSLPRSLEAVENSKEIYVLTTKPLDSVTLEEESEEADDTKDSTGIFLIDGTARDGWIGKAARTLSQVKTLRTTSENPYKLIWHCPPESKNTEGGYLQRCPACGAGGSHTSVLSRFISYTDAPLEVMIDSLFELLPEADWDASKPTRRKLLTFSDGRQDAAFFASDFQRTHTEALYRQMVWQAFQAVKDSEGIASVNQMQDELVRQFLVTSIPHPDRNEKLHHLSYVADDEVEEKAKNSKDCRDLAQARAKELMLREFGLPSARRFSIESLGLLACHIEWQPAYIEKVAEKFNMQSVEAKVFLTALTDLIRLSGIVDLENPSKYFPEVGGVEGGKPSILDGSGRLKKYLKLQKSPKDSKDAVSFSAYKTATNRTVKTAIYQYCAKVLGLETPEQGKEALFWLYDDVLIPSNILSKFGSEGRKLNWDLLNIREVAEDWCRCNKCQQLFHLPGFSQLRDDPKLAVKQCPTFKCEGSLSTYLISDEDMQADHYRVLIRDRQGLALRSQEHTAQLTTKDLATRESRFRQGKINLLSCSTTLEMGVDIGELQAVALRNFPPHVSNYQQRAGRAGRRTDGVAVTLMYGQRRPHDRYYFEKPEELIAGKNQIPTLDPQNPQIQERHIRAELLAEFLRDKDRGTEDVKISDFLGLPDAEEITDPNFIPPASSLIVEFQEWLQSDRARNLTELWLKRLGSRVLPLPLIEQFSQKISEFQADQLRDWSTLAEVMLELRERLPKELKNMETIVQRIKSTKKELEKIADRRLHDELARASILPIYGFPIDVVRLMTGNVERHRLERDRRMALGEYAPNQEIVVDDRVHTSVGVVSPNKLEERYYWVCHHCNYFDYDVKQKDFSSGCLCCGKPPRFREGKAKLCKIPNTFTTHWSKPAKVTPYTKPVRQPTSQVFLAQEGKNSEKLGDETFYRLTYSQGGSFFLSNQGSIEKGRGFKNRGFALCQLCGRDLTKEVLDKEEEAKKAKKRSSAPIDFKISHIHPMRDVPCPGGYEWIHLGHTFLSDLLRIRFHSTTNPPALYSTRIDHVVEGDEIASVEGDTSKSETGMGFWRSLTSALLAASAQVIDVPRSELDGLFSPSEARDGTAEIVLYDKVPGGAGYCRKIGERFKEVLQRAYEIVADCSCGSSCYDCLRTYSNQPFHDELDRIWVKEFLQSIAEQVNPERYPELQDFAPDSYQLSSTQFTEHLVNSCRKATANSIVYLPEWIEAFSLKRLTELITSLKYSGSRLELIVNQLPESTTPQGQVLRRRLQQWIEQDAMHLYQSSSKAFLELCLSSQQNHRIALRLQPSQEDSPARWLQTRTERGVQVVLERLERIKKQARLVNSKELEDSNVEVIFPVPSWGALSVAELRQRLKLEKILTGSPITQLTYRDRYFYKEHAQVFADLLACDAVRTGTKIEIRTRGDHPNKWNAIANSQRKTEITMALSKLKQSGALLQVKVQPIINDHLDHARILEIHRLDGQRYQVLFDQGMSFLTLTTGGRYEVKEPTYVVIDQQS